jgi:hypothetical protein
MIKQMTLSLCLVLATPFAHAGAHDYMITHLTLRQSVYPHMQNGQERMIRTMAQIRTSFEVGAVLVNDILPEVINVRQQELQKIQDLIAAEPASPFRQFLETRLAASQARVEQVATRVQNLAESHARTYQVVLQAQLDAQDPTKWEATYNALLTSEILRTHGGLAQRFSGLADGDGWDTIEQTSEQLFRESAHRLEPKDNAVTVVRDQGSSGLSESDLNRMCAIQISFAEKNSSSQINLFRDLGFVRKVINGQTALECRISRGRASAELVRRNRGSTREVLRFTIGTSREFRLFESSSGQFFSPPRIDPRIDSFHSYPTRQILRAIR